MTWLESFFSFLFYFSSIFYFLFSIFYFLFPISIFYFLFSIFYFLLSTFYFSIFLLCYCRRELNFLIGIGEVLISVRLDQSKAIGKEVRKISRFHFLLLSGGLPYLD